MKQTLALFFLGLIVMVAFFVPACTGIPTPAAVPVTQVIQPTRITHPTPTNTVPSTPSPTATNTPLPTNPPPPTLTPIPSPTATPTTAPDLSALNPITVCAAECDYSTIQAAIDAAGPGDLIYVTDAIHTEAGIIVNKDVTIQGRGANETVIQAREKGEAATDRVFLVTADADVAITGLTIQYGNPADLMRYGGGILNQGRLTLTQAVVQHNRANCGGGIVSQGGRLVIDRSTISYNTADGEAQPGLDCGSGGGIKLVEGGGLTLTNSTLSHNNAGKYGGGLHVSCESEAELVNVTISGNQADRMGGGINAGGVVRLTHCTISHNRARGISLHQRVEGKAGGGIATKGTLYLVNTLIANHSPYSGDCVLREGGKIGTNSHTWVEDNSCSSTYSGDPKLGSLADNGGETQTHALLPDSPAIDLLPAEACPVDLDQRGRPRAAAETLCDIGAFEFQVE
jgi:hypothetical protein